MPNITESYLKVPYDVRVNKQVERRMLLDSLQRLNGADFPIRNYQYTGFGSIFFVDFIMFHKLLGLSRMLSVEHSRVIEKRVRFNCPFDNNIIDIKFGPISNFIPKLDRDLKHILWLDYDCYLNKDVLDDVKVAASTLSTGSILLVTVDVDTRSTSELETYASKDEYDMVDEITEFVKLLTPIERKLFYEKHFGNYIEPSWKNKDFAPINLPATLVRILSNAIKDGLSGRREVAFLPLYNFLYADGHKMLTFGGMIGGETEERQLKSCDFEDVNFMRFNIETPPYEIKAPIITRKERLHLDSSMPCPAGWTPSEFELDAAAVNAYSEIYRYYPAYAEMLL